MIYACNKDFRKSKYTEIWNEMLLYLLPSVRISRKSAFVDRMNIVVAASLEQKKK